LKDYKAKLVLFPKKKLAAPGKGEASVAEQTAATQLKGTVMPLTKPVPTVETMKVTADMQKTLVHSQLRGARTDAKLVGVREKQKKAKAAAEEEKKSKE
jgi:large subunit ribosomal protein L13e